MLSVAVFEWAISPRAGRKQDMFLFSLTRVVATFVNNLGLVLGFYL